MKAGIGDSKFRFQLFAVEKFCVSEFTTYHTQFQRVIYFEI